MRAKIQMIFFNTYYEMNTKYHLITILGEKLKFFKKNSNHALSSKVTETSPGQIKIDNTWLLLSWKNLEKN